MKRILIFCDGTWNSPDDARVTNVVNLRNAVVEDENQTVIYIPGVGTGGRWTTFVGKWMNKIGGGAFGWGLNQNIKVAYAALAEQYNPGDKIMIFGFSRGAYTARSLVGMIRKCGLPAKNKVTKATVNKAFRIYRKRGTKHRPDADKIWPRRKRISPYATSKTDQTKRGDNAFILHIEYLGIWDTVGALGIPSNLLGTFSRHVNSRHQFHDTHLTKMVKSARHAVALDERRKFYLPSLWENLDSGPGGGLNNGKTGAARRFQQMWFIGDHRVLGGRSTAGGLVSYPLQWIIDGATNYNMKLKSNVRLPKDTPNAMQAAPEMNNPKGFYKLQPGLLGWRTGPLQDADRHPSVDERLAADPLYRPRSMASLRPDLWPQSRSRIT
ncbi:MULTISPECIES: DUF2235 domain-containing protein [unclassified Roseovarius]|uniref:DUF2235 domain-containing protein n=1 Tax=unclassified Roseovarius TaxID=2614913 RepID=UPI00273F59A5|nr:MULTISPECIES: DUF2235 domain-containing protein [unclassified Roseovarius]